MRDVAKPYDNNNTPKRDRIVLPDESPAFEESSSGVAWPAVIGGAIVATAVSLLLLVLGTGIGLSTISPMPAAGASPANANNIMGAPVKTIVWLVAMQIIASGFGGYLTGRLRTKWVGLENKEVFFRDTANGFLSWAVATIIAATLFASAAAMVINNSARAMAGIMNPMEAGNTVNSPVEALVGPNSYLVASLFRTDSPVTTNESPIDAREEASNIIINGVRNGGLSDNDRSMLAQVVTAQTGLSQDEAMRRVDNVSAQISQTTTTARDALDSARRMSAYLALVVCISMLVGAFVASYSAALGGKHRDNAHA